MAATTARAAAQDRQRRPEAAGRALPVVWSVVLGVLLVVATGYGLLVADPYPASPGVRETFPSVLRGQDLLTLATVPALVWAAVRARAGSPWAHLGWLGLLFYYAYTYVMYAFSPFTDVFLAYVAIIGMSSHGLLDGLLRLDVATIDRALRDAPRRATGWFLLVVAVLFAVMWLAMIVPAIPGGLPAGRMTYDIASAVHILDLAFVLPLLAATGAMLLRGHPAGPALAGVLLSLKVTLGLALLSMSFAFTEEPAWGEAGLWSLIVAVSTGWLVAGLHRRRPVEGPWLRPTLWPSTHVDPDTPDTSHLQNSNQAASPPNRTL